MKLIPILSEIETKLEKLYKNYSLSYWNASLTGKEEDWYKVTKTQLELTKFFQNRNYFSQLEKLKSNLSTLDEVNQRVVEILYREFLPNQYDLKKLEEIISIQNKIENVFTTFRTNYNNKTLTDNEVDEILKKETNSRILKDVWEANKLVGSLIADDLLSLVKLRNEQAKYFGYSNFHEMCLYLTELNYKVIDKIFKDLFEKIESSYRNIKNQIDYELSQRFGVNENDLMPWNYQNRFFQEAPAIYYSGLDKFYQGINLVEITRTYFNNLGLFLDDILIKSDLYERKGKNQHAFCISIDRSRDIRVLCNVRPNVDWMGTMLHEFGHAVYYKFIDVNLPFSLRDAAHIFVTEAIALLFGKHAIHPAWIKETFRIDEKHFLDLEESTIRLTKINQLIFANWVMLMYEFEKELYSNQDQDLNELWWKLHNHYLKLNIPSNRNKPDWATKIHIATSPCYYHNYLLGEILASQLNQYLQNNILLNHDIWKNAVINNPAIGEFLIMNLFKFGSLMRWDALIKFALNEELNHSYYINHHSMY